MPGRLRYRTGGVADRMARNVVEGWTKVMKFALVRGAIGAVERRWEPMLPSD